MKRFFELIDRNVIASAMSRATGIFKKSEDRKSNPLITLSREFGSGGSAIAFAVSKKLGKPWKVYHDAIVEEIAKGTNLEKDLVEKIDEGKIPLIEGIVDSIFGRRYLNLGSYYKQLIKMLSAIGTEGHAIIVGRGSNFLFPNSLRIRIIADMGQRIETIMKYRKVSEDVAKNMIDKSDRKRVDFVQALFNHDPRKAHHYDCIIQVGENLTLDQATNLIVHLAKKKFKL